MADDILDNRAWFKKVKDIQRGPTGPVKTSASKQSEVQLGLTTFSISEYMQGSALHSPDSLAYEVAKKNIYGSLTNLLGDENAGSISPISLAMLPLEVLAQSQLGTGTGGEVGDSGTTTQVRDGTAVPEEIKRFGNGKIPTELLVPVGIASHKLYSAAAVMFRNMVSAAKEDGVALNLTDSYRSYQQQVVTKRKRGNLAATPGKSNHGWGLAVDMKWEDGSGGNTNSKGFRWMTANASRYGWVHPDWAKPGGSKPEPWHWEYRGELNVGGGGSKV